MKSDQMDQITNQLKEKVQQIQEFYSEKKKAVAFAVTSSRVGYEDLISSEDQEFWVYLCKKDYKRVNKLLTQNIGEGYFLDDSYRRRLQRRRRG